MFEPIGKEIGMRTGKQKKNVCALKTSAKHKMEEESTLFGCSLLPENPFSCCLSCISLSIALSLRGDML